MGNHYIPRYYLKGFATVEDSGQIYLYRKGQVVGIKTNIVNVGQENDLYPDAIESKIAQEVEQIANPILDKIRNFQLPTQDEKINFARYIMVMRIRVPKQKAWFQRGGPEILKETINEIDKELLELEELHPDKKEIVNKRRQELRNFSP
jgi:hypothetical protein